MPAPSLDCSTYPLDLPILFRKCTVADGWNFNYVHRWSRSLRFAGTRSNHQSAREFQIDLHPYHRNQGQVNVSFNLPPLVFVFSFNHFCCCVFFFLPCFALSAPSNDRKIASSRAEPRHSGAFGCHWQARNWWQFWPLRPLGSENDRKPGPVWWGFYSIIASTLLCFTGLLDITAIQYPLKYCCYISLQQMWTHSMNIFNMWDQRMAVFRIRGKRLYYVFEIPWTVPPCTVSIIVGFMSYLPVYSMYSPVYHYYVH